MCQQLVSVAPLLKCKNDKNVLFSDKDVKSSSYISYLYHLSLFYFKITETLPVIRLIGCYVQTTLIQRLSVSD